MHFGMDETRFSLQGTESVSDMTQVHAQVCSGPNLLLEGLRCQFRTLPAHPETKLEGATKGATVLEPPPSPTSKDQKKMSMALLG